MIIAITMESARLLSVDADERTVYIETDPRPSAVQCTIEARPAATVAEFDNTNAPCKNAWVLVGARGGLEFVK